MGAQGSQALFGNGANQLVPGGGAVGGRQTITPQFQAEQKQQLRDQLPDRKKNPRGMNSTATGQGGGMASFTPPPGQMPQSGPAGGMPSGPYGPMRGGLRVGTSPWAANNRFK